MVLVDPLQIGPRPTRILRRAGTFSARTERVAASWVHWQHRFEPEVIDPVIDEVVDVSETLPLVQVQLAKRHVMRVVLEGGTAETRVAVFLAVDTEGMQVLVAPGEDDLQCNMERGQRHVATQEEAPPDQRADPCRTTRN